MCRVRTDCRIISRSAAGRALAPAREAERLALVGEFVVLPGEDREPTRGAEPVGEGSHEFCRRSRAPRDAGSDRRVRHRPVYVGALVALDGCGGDPERSGANSTAATRREVRRSLGRQSRRRTAALSRSRRGRPADGVSRQFRYGTAVFGVIVVPGARRRRSGGRTRGP